jgi:hypothetical protein
MELLYAFIFVSMVYHLTCCASNVLYTEKHILTQFEICALLQQQQQLPLLPKQRKNDRQKDKKKEKSM